MKCSLTTPPNMSWSVLLVIYAALVYSCSCSLTATAVPPSGDGCLAPKPASSEAAAVTSSESTVTSAVRQLVSLSHAFTLVARSLLDSHAYAHGFCVLSDRLHLRGATDISCCLLQLSCLHTVQCTSGAERHNLCAGFARDVNADWCRTHRACGLETANMKAALANAC